MACRGKITQIGRRFLSTYKGVAGGGQLVLSRHIPVCSSRPHQQYFVTPRHLSITSSQDSFIPDLSKASLTVNKSKHKLTIKWNDTESSIFHSAWLRHNCQCDQCIQPYSGQKIIDLTTISDKHTIGQAEIKDGMLYVQCPEEIHIIKIPLSHLYKNDYSDNTMAMKLKSRSPPLLNENDSGVPEISYDEVVSSTEGRYRWLKNISDYGLCLMKGIPQEVGTAKSVGDFIWPVQRTIYGEEFEVISDSKPINVAYSDANLPFHMDLVYYESPPGIQLLRCLKFDECVTGGESLFVDSFAIARHLKRSAPQAFEVLKRVPATFQKIHYDRDHPVYMRYQRPHIVTNPTGNVVNVNWAPAFEGPLRVGMEEVEAYYDSYMKFAKLVETIPNRVEFTLEVGDMIAFNNRRILHARKGFELNGGQRHLQGVYVNIDEFESELEVLTKQLNKTDNVKRSGNQNLL